MHKEVEFIIDALRNYDKNLAKVLNMRTEAGSEKGNHYKSDFLKIKIEFLNQSGDIQERSVVLKCLPNCGTVRELVQSSKIFPKEARVYREILATMENIIRSHTPEMEPLFPQYIGSDDNSQILLEDLKASGFELAGNRMGLDFDHCAILLKSLGKFHALGAILKQNNELAVDDYCRYYYEEKNDFSSMLFRNNFNEIAWILENKWKGVWLGYAERLRKVSSTIGLHIAKLFEREDTRFNTFLHGDCCYLNAMFKHGENGMPTAVRILDFQNSWVNSVGFDLNYFLWTSVHTDDRLRTAELIKLYHESLSYHLRLYGYAKEPPCLKDVEADLDRTAVYGLVMSLSVLGFLFQPPDRVPDMKELSSKMTSASESATYINRDNSETENYKRTMQCIIKTGAELCLI